MDLARDRSISVVVDAVLTKNLPEFDSFLMLGPVLNLPHEGRLKVLKAARSLLKFAAYPLNGARLVCHEESQLPQLAGSVSLTVILSNLRRQKIHPVSLRIALTQ